MGDMTQQYVIEASATQVYEAISQPAHIARWWTSDVQTEGEPGVGAILEMGFYERAIVTRCRVEALQPPQHIQWRYIEGPPEYIGSVITFQLVATDEAATHVDFRHTDLDASDEFLAHAAQSWQHVLNSLKAYLETGTGDPIST